MKEENKRCAALLAVSALCFLGFATVLYFVASNRISPFDDAIRYFFYERRSPALSALLIPVTYLGNWQAIVGISAVLLIVRRTRMDFGLPAALSSVISNGAKSVVKNCMKRTRPDKSLHLIEQGGYSFPSGHATTSIVFYGMLAYSLRRYFVRQNRRGAARTVVLAAALLIFLIGISRVYVGVHYPSDVLAGWLIGGGLLSLFILVREKLDR